MSEEQNQESGTIKAIPNQELVNCKPALTDNALIADLLGTFSRHGYNCDRSNLNIHAAIALQDMKEMNNRLELILETADKTRPPPWIEVPDMKSNG